MFTQRIIVKNVFFLIPEVDMKCSVLLPHNGLYFLIGFVSGYLMISS